MADLAARKQALLARLKELDARLHDIEDELDSEHSKDWEDQAVEREGEEVLEQLGHSGQEEILRIRAALGRIREGDYGFCMRCGDEIAPARLDVLPEAPLCTACAGKTGH